MSDEPLTPEKIGSLAATFLESTYGIYLMSQLTQQHFRRHEQAESADDKDLPRLMHEAAMIREITDLITKPAEMHTAGYFTQQEQAAKEAEREVAVDPSLAP